MSNSELFVMHREPTNQRPQDRIFPLPVRDCRCNDADAVSMHMASHGISNGTPQETPPQSQQEYYQEEIALNTWEFNSSQISRMLWLKGDFGPEDVKSFQDAARCCEFLVDAPLFQLALDQAIKSLSSNIPVWPTTSKEEDCFEPLTKFLNNSVQHCHAALDHTRSSHEKVPELIQRLHHRLRFEYDRNMIDGIDGAEPVKVGCGGGKDLTEGERLCWSPPKGKEAIKVPAEVGPEWSNLLSQAAVHGRCLFSASPTRSWSLVFGFNNNDKCLRFLIFHRGGCTASTAMDLGSELGRKEAYQLILTMLLWTEDYHAGFSSFSTDEEYAIPDTKRNLTSRARVVKNLHQRVGAICTRGTAVSVVQAKSPAITGPSPQLVPPTGTLGKLVGSADKPRIARSAASQRDGVIRDEESESLCM